MARAVTARLSKWIAGWRGVGRKKRPVDGFERAPSWRVLSVKIHSLTPLIMHRWSDAKIPAGSEAL